MLLLTSLLSASDFEKTFKPHQVKPGVHIAPINRFARPIDDDFPKVEPMSMPPVQGIPIVIYRKLCADADPSVPQIL